MEKRSWFLNFAPKAMKSILRSKTVWFNLLTIAVAIGTFFGWAPNQDLAEQVTGYLLVITPAVNLLLRFITDQGVYLFRKP